ncbi:MULTISPECIES: AraC family transcriptional regulator [unclassified Xanthobacter]|uniref:AraC family transcriptional regulator n=1 Tax=unclassified Xanthobacter TaxID=2623496 RepID=UPI001F2EF4A6|nr:MULTISPECIES: AraC family transcriptional regulator [unclassified Xanthobacter]
MERRMISPGFVDDALQCLRRRGIDEAVLLARAGLPAKVSEPVSAERYGALWLAIAEAIDDEFFGEGARPMRSGSFTLLCHAILSAATLEQALKRALRFLRLVMDDPYGELVVAEGLAQIVLKDAGAPRSAFAYRTYWIVVHGITCWLVGRRIPLRRVDFRCGPPAHGADYRLFFGAPVRFGQEQSRLVFDADFLKLPAIRDERALREFLRRAPANILVRYRHDAGLLAKVRARLRATPPVSWPGFVELAAQLRIPEPTLRRRLRLEGQTYRDIKDELRRALAMEALAAGGRDVGEIAAELGFSEPSAFHRAFRKWTGKSPGAWRREAMGEG